MAEQEAESKNKLVWQGGRSELRLMGGRAQPADLAHLGEEEEVSVHTQQEPQKALSWQEGRGGVIQFIS